MERHARTFEEIRPEVLDRLVDVRGSIDHTLSGVPAQVIRQEFDAVLDRMQSYLADGNAGRYRSFAARWMPFGWARDSHPKTSSIPWSRSEM